MEGISDCMRICHKSNVSFGKISGMSQCPQWTAIAGNNHRFPVKNPFQNLPVAVISMQAYRRFRSIISMTGTNNRNRKTGCPVCCHQHFFGCDLMPWILPVRIHQRSAFCNTVISQRLLIGGCTTDKNILLRLIPEQTNVTFYIFCRISNELGNHIITFICDSLRYGFLIMNVGNDTTHAFGQFPWTSVEQCNLPPSLLCQLYYIGTDGTGPSNE